MKSNRTGFQFSWLVAETWVFVQIIKVGGKSDREDLMLRSWLNIDGQLIADDLIIIYIYILTTRLTTSG